MNEKAFEFMIVEELKPIGLIPEKREWRQGDGDFDRGSLSFYVSVGGKTFRKSIPQENLSDGDALPALNFLAGDFLTKIKNSFMFCESCDCVLKDSGIVETSKPPALNFSGVCKNPSCSKYLQRVMATEQVFVKDINRTLRR
jgi:hypothetical protein